MDYVDYVLSKYNFAANPRFFHTITERQFVKYNFNISYKKKYYTNNYYKLNAIFKLYTSLQF